MSLQPLKNTLSKKIEKNKSLKKLKVIRSIFKVYLPVTCSELEVGTDSGWQVAWYARAGRVSVLCARPSAPHCVRALFDLWNLRPQPPKSIGCIRTVDDSKRFSHGKDSICRSVCWRPNGSAHHRWLMLMSRLKFCF